VGSSVVVAHPPQGCVCCGFTNALLHTSVIMRGYFSQSYSSISLNQSTHSPLTSSINKALEKDPELLGKALMGDDGLLKRMSNSLDPYTKRDGALKGRKSGLEASEKRVNERMEALDRRMNSAYKRYLNQFTTMNQMMQTMGSL